MKLTVKTLKGTLFDIQVHPSDTVMAVKKSIETVQGKDNYPWGQQLLIHSGKVLKDETTLEENKISEDAYLVVMLSKSKTSATTGASSATKNKTLATTGASSASQPASSAPPAPHVPLAPTEIPSRTSVPVDIVGGAADRGMTEIPTFDQATSNLTSGSNIESMVPQLMGMGGGNWDKDTVQLALRAAYNNPERAVEYLYSGIPTAGEDTQAQGPNTSDTATAGTILSGLPNSAPLNMFPQGTPSLGSGGEGGALDFLRNSQQFQALRAMVQANPQILQPMLQELSKQNPQLLGLIQDHNAEFHRLINEPVEGLEGDLFDQPDEDMPHPVSVTPAEQDFIERLEAMGFDRERVIEAYLACDRNEQMAANYLLEHAGDED